MDVIIPAACLRPCVERETGGRRLEGSTVNDCLRGNFHCEKVDRVSAFCLVLWTGSRDAPESQFHDKMDGDGDHDRSSSLLMFELFSKNARKLFGKGGRRFRPGTKRRSVCWNGTHEDPDSA